MLFSDDPNRFLNMSSNKDEVLSLRSVYIEAMRTTPTSSERKESTFLEVGYQP
jgi:hypothetical protein